MEWVCQLGDGFMLGRDGQNLVRQETGYPYPDTNEPQVNMLFELYEAYGIYYSIDVFRKHFKECINDINKRFVDDNVTSIPLDSFFYGNRLQDMSCVMYNTHTIFITKYSDALNDLLCKKAHTLGNIKSTSKNVCIIVPVNKLHSLYNLDSTFKNATTTQIEDKNINNFMTNIISYHSFEDIYLMSFETLRSCARCFLIRHNDTGKLFYMGKLMFILDKCKFDKMFIGNFIDIVLNSGYMRDDYKDLYTILSKPITSSKRGSLYNMFIRACCRAVSKAILFRDDVKFVRGSKYKINIKLNGIGILSKVDNSKFDYGIKSILNIAEIYENNIVVDLQKLFGEFTDLAVRYYHHKMAGTKRIFRGEALKNSYRGIISDLDITKDCLISPNSVFTSTDMIYCSNDSYVSDTVFAVFRDAADIVINYLGDNFNLSMSDAFIKQGIITDNVVAKFIDKNKESIINLIVEKTFFNRFNTSLPIDLINFDIELSYFNSENYLVLYFRRR